MSKRKKPPEIKHWVGWHPQRGFYLGSPFLDAPMAINHLTLGQAKRLYESVNFLAPKETA